MTILINSIDYLREAFLSSKFDYPFKIHCYFIARFDWSSSGSIDAVARHVSFGQITCTIAVQQFLLSVRWQQYSNKKAQLSLGKTRYSLYSSCCSTDFSGRPRSIFLCHL